MHWVLQENFTQEQGYIDLLATLERAGIPHSIHKVVPFVGELEPDIDPPNPVIVIGSYSMRHVAKRKGWIPGAFVNENFDFEVCLANWGKELLNHDAHICRFDAVPFLYPDGFFMRPCEDSKTFAGSLFGWDEYIDWRTRVVDLGEDDGSTLKPETRVMVAPPREIVREYRLWVVDRRIVTASVYKMGDRVLYDGNVEPEILHYGDYLVQRWVPDRAFVLDVGLVEGKSVLPDLKIIEVNCLNAAGFYAANVGKLVEALEGMGYS